MAAFWFRKSAELGNPYAQSMLATALLRGEGITRDPIQAADWLHKAAKQGDIGAKAKLGDLYPESVTPIKPASLWC